MSGFDDPQSPGNGPKHHTGKPCIERGCDAPAGTAWSQYWCFKHNVERMNRISASLKRIIRDFDKLTSERGGS